MSTIVDKTYRSFSSFALTKMSFTEASLPVLWSWTIPREVVRPHNRVFMSRYVTPLLALRSLRLRNGSKDPRLQLLESHPVACLPSPTVGVRLQPCHRVSDLHQAAVRPEDCGHDRSTNVDFLPSRVRGKYAMFFPPSPSLPTRPPTSPKHRLLRVSRHVYLLNALPPMIPSVR